MNRDKRGNVELDAAAAADRNQPSRKNANDLLLLLLTSKNNWPTFYLKWAGEKSELKKS